MRYFIELAYKGTAYHGWQIQPDARSVQETIEKSLSTLLRSNLALVGCGRTDTGVHAEQYFGHFDWEEKIDTLKLGYQLNSILPSDIAVFRIFRVKDGAHARFDAALRSYQYRILVGKNPFMQETTYQVMRFDADLDLMNQAAELLCNHSDFKCFSRSKTDVKTYICKIEEAFWKREGNRLTFEIRADRFLRNMVRAIVGTLIEVGEGKRSLQAFEELLESRDRTLAGPSAKAHGLHLTRIEYPETIY